MRCTECGSDDFTSTVGTASFLGLSDTTIEGVTLQRCNGCGEGSTSIPALGRLIDAFVADVLSGLSAEEVRLVATNLQCLVEVARSPTESDDPHAIRAHDELEAFPKLGKGQTVPRTATWDGSRWTVTRRPA